jgi:hypothetical protein
MLLQQIRDSGVVIRKSSKVIKSSTKLYEIKSIEQFHDVRDRIVLIQRWWRKYLAKKSKRFYSKPTS